MIPENIFRAYDIRGIVREDLTEEVVEKIGKAFGTSLGENKTVVVGRDVRSSGEVLGKAFISGLNSCGCNVIDIGTVTTPILYFSVPTLKAGAGAMITASHNPKEWNGFKLCDSNGLIYHSDFLQNLLKMIKNGKFIKSRAGKITKYEKIIKDYTDYVTQKISKGRKLKIVVDSGNGTASSVAPTLFKKLGHGVIEINDGVDEDFPGRGPDPTKENVLNELKERVKKENADLGVAYDGDGDRVVFVDDSGREISSGSIIIMILAKDILQRHKNGKIVFDCCCSMTVEAFIRANGGIPVIERVGHSFIIHRMQEENAIFAGEYSNHFYFPEIPGYDDAVFGSLRMTEILSKSDKSFSQIVDSVPKYFYKSDIEFKCSDEKKFGVVKKIKEKMKSSGYKISELDGVKVFFDDGWVVWRASNTRPVITGFIEAKTKERFDELQGFLESEITSVLKGD